MHTRTRMSNRALGATIAMALAVPAICTLGTATAEAASAPSCISTPTDFAEALLAAGGEPETAQNIEAIVAWAHAEGGNWKNNAKFNPLDTTKALDGSTPINSVGVQAYSSWAVGVQATELTLTNGHYGGVLSALAAGNSAVAVANAVAASPWGTPNFSSLIGQAYAPPAPPWQPSCTFVPQPGDFDNAGIDDLSGDGHADLVFRAGASVQYLPNNSNSNPGGVPFVGNSSQVAAVGGSDLVAFGSVAGSKYADLFDYSPSTGLLGYLANNGAGYQGSAVTVANLGGGIKKIMLADVTGDGHADLVYEKSDDTIWYLPNNIDATSDHLPFSNEGAVQIAVLPTTTTAVTMGDVTGDGYAELLYVNNGDLFYVPNNILNHSDHLPFTGEVGIQIATGYGAVTQMTAADVSGDKYADLLWADASGSVYYAPNFVNSDGTHTFFPSTGTRVAGIATTAELG